MSGNAVRTSALEARISHQSSQLVDFNQWIYSNLNLAGDETVLELCCGTGSQTQIFSKALVNGSVIAVDLNSESIEVNQKKVNSSNVKYVVSNIDSSPDIAPDDLDLIFCSYGFYYSKNPVELFNELCKKLRRGGRFVLVGPVLGNNIELYRVVRALGEKIPDDVLYSSERFMIDFFERFVSVFDDVRFFRTKNNVKYLSIKDLYDYWSNTTFFVPGKESEFNACCEAEFKNNIVITKSISWMEGIYVN